MKAPSPGNTPGNINPLVGIYLAQARHRERYWIEFKTEMQLIGARLRRLRREKGYSLERVAADIRMSKYRLYKIECGSYRHFETHDLQRLTRLYGTTSLEILSVIPDTSFERLI